MTPLTLTSAPIPKLEEALDNARKSNNWFEAIVLTAIQLERYSFFAVRDYLENCKVDSRLIASLIGRDYLPQLAKYLLILGKIDNSENITICRINTVRNQYIHRKGESRACLTGTNATKTYEPLVMEALRILREKLNVVRGYATPG